MSKELTVRAKADNMVALLQKNVDSFAALLPKYLTPEKMLTGIMAQARRNPRILECSPNSVLNCVVVASGLGLALNGRGGAYLVPFKNRGKYEATLIPDYRGLMDLAYRSGQVKSITAECVYERDTFEYEYGAAPKLRHVPLLNGARGSLIAAYAVALMDNGIPQFAILSTEQINAHRDRSRASGNGPWVTDYDAMAKKTAIKVLTNYLPQAPEKLVMAAEVEDRLDAGDSLAGMFDGVIEIDAEDTEGQSAKVAEELQARNTEQPASPEPGGDGGPSAPTDAPTPSASASPGDVPWIGNGAPEPRKMRGEDAHEALLNFRAGIKDAHGADMADAWWTETGTALYAAEDNEYAKDKMAELCVHFIGPGWTAKF